MNIECMLSCDLCGAKKVKFQVRPRDPACESIVGWMDRVVRPAMLRAHLSYDILCQGTHARLYLPCPEGAEYVGQDPDTITSNPIPESEPKEEQQ